jgi:octaprenyl-diphosphate synthase
LNKYKLILERIEAILQQNLPRDFPQLTEPCSELLSRGGKRWRPLLMALVCESSGGGDAALPLSPLVEFCHNASLIHDDIEDNSDLRRGKPAIHKLYGIDTAINSGCFLYFLPLVCIDKWNASAEFKLRLYTLWAEHIRNLHLGQSFDISWHKNADFIPSIDEYFKMCALKTGVLAKFAVIAGALAAENADPLRAVEIAEKSNVLANAAENLGIAFQILDDVKNLTAQIEGKEKGDDIVEGKKSLPVLYFLQAGADFSSDVRAYTVSDVRANFTSDVKHDRLQLVKRCWKAAATGGAGVREVAELISALEESGALAQAQKKGRHLLDEAKSDFCKCSNIFG